ncbi:uncharacterized protein LOC123675823 isoform X1 [Harmonia axyridis]|uniref:uncharacterized protein LOC123675823 isoform X1 n=1 Tax=Harmonia axyridis TaxID=115357 RepID=UPI001E2791D8|nr:uncharacterized protein LOC123675823 isoform X1 [Harmonia axyridis]
MESREYQQLMFNLLGNRDYDNFESNELDSLKKKIGYALFGHPSDEKGYDSNQNVSIDKLFEIILKESNEFSKYKNRVIVSFVYNCTEPLDQDKQKRAAKYKDYDPKTDVQPQPVFILRKCKYSPTSCRIVIDNLGRVYKSWEEYLCRNTLPKCNMVYPKNGRYTGDEKGNVVLETMPSPSCNLSAKVLVGTDVASTGVGIASAGVAIAASIPTVTVVGPVALVGAGVVGLGVGIYSIGRSIGSLYDKRRHKESLCFSNSAARAAYINIIAGAMGFIGAGTNVAVSQLASRGVSIGKETSILVNAISAANLGTSGLAILNSGYNVLEPWMKEGKPPTLLSLVQLSSSILFFGHAVYNFKSASAIVEDTQNKVLKDIHENLKHNRSRKAFEKLRHEAIRKNNGDVQRGNADVIATMRKIIDKDQLLEILLGSDTDFEDMGLTCTSKLEGLVSFNGVQIDLNEVSSLPDGKIENFFSLSRSSEAATPSNICEIKDNIKNSFITFNLEGRAISKISNYFVGMTGSLTYIAGPLLGVVKEFLQEYLIKDEHLLKAMNELFPNSDEKSLQIINTVAGFIYEEARKIEMMFKISDSVEGRIFKSLFNYVSKMDERDRLKYFMKFVCESYYQGGQLTKEGLDELKRYFAKLMTEQMVLYRDKKNRRDNRLKEERKVERVKCPNCHGLHYSVVKPEKLKPVQELLRKSPKK